MGATDPDPGMDRAQALADRLFRARAETFDVYTGYLGERLGLYRALRDGSWRTVGEVAGLTGTDERYLREWLEHQAASGILEVQDASDSPAARRFRLPNEHARVLADPDDPLFTAPNLVEVGRVARQLPALVEAFRSGGGLESLPWEPEGRAEYNRAIFLNLLGREWLPAIPPIHDRLSGDLPARVADVGCGTGWSSIAMAQAYPAIEVDGFDLEERVIALARDHAAESGVADRVRFTVGDAAALSGQHYDLVTVFEALHDMPNPVEVLTALRRILRPGGSVLVADELVAEQFTAPADDRERYVYGWSVMGCLGGAMGEPGTAATGAVMRPDTLRRYAADAGFERVDMFPVENDYFHFYVLTP